MSTTHPTSEQSSGLRQENDVKKARALKRILDEKKLRDEKEKEIRSQVCAWIVHVLVALSHGHHDHLVPAPLCR